MSLRLRLLAATLALVTVGLTVAGAATYEALNHFLYNRLDDQLTSARVGIERALRTADGDFVVTSIDQLRAIAPGFFVQVRDADGNVLITTTSRAGAAEVPRIPASLPSLPPAQPFGGAGRGDSEPARLFTVGSADNQGPHFRVRETWAAGGTTLLLALPLNEVESTLHRLVLVEVLVGLGVLVLAAFCAYWLIELGLRPLHRIETAAETIAEESLAERVPGEDGRTEVGRLARVLNVMLGRIETAFEQRRETEAALRSSEDRLRRFVSDASHELRTPIAAIRAYAELYRRGAATRPEDLARIMPRVESEAERMGVLVDELLLLTRLDQGRPIAQDAVDLGAVANDAVEVARAVDPDRPITLSVQGSVEIRGDRSRLRQVVDNLLTNVRVHTPAGTPAHVSVRSDGSFAVLEVADQGPGIPDEESAAVFERFYRRDAGRARDRGGAGLGLSIVAGLAQAHGGEATAHRAAGGGALFRVTLPLLDGPTAPTGEAVRAEPTSPVGHARP